VTTRDIIHGYTDAWTRGDLNAARGFLADDVDFEGSMETHRTADGFIGGLGHFRRELFADHTVLHDVVQDDKAFLLYDCALKTGASLRCAEYFEVAAGKIRKIRLVFDTGKLPKGP
jgi:ketosteroid isomerase-like protein